MRVILQKIAKLLPFCLAILFISPVVKAIENNNQIPAKTPQRVIVLDWDLLEQILTLEVIPIGATEITGYNQWVAYPVAPNSIEEIGMRAEPNLEKIASLKPDLILASRSQQDLLPVLKTIAPVVYLPNFSRQDNAAQVALAHFNTLASLFGKQAIAQQKLTEMEATFIQLKAKLQQAFITLPEVEVIRFSTLTSVFLYTENSTTDYVVNKLGLKSAISLPPQPWGIDQRRMKVLQQITQGYVLYMLPFPDEAKLKKSVLWQAMPFVQNGHFHSMKPVWNYGGVTSLTLMAEAITESLLDMAPNNEN
ncbi:MULTISPECIES: iron-siderophore ABC transporter substrate-binding protein [Gammaproteobacteria]|uniref:iron-siderophore ABC transporter substrate-binding protein n=1 Tax=Gammaproteobacteria TaxID=1236 RepID=UPI00186840AA|nr:MULTISPECIES: iron-siderophore ABC transporter substrate-binding protein [Gammaproteobacteria]